jgi:hypothetical protein
MIDGIVFEDHTVLIALGISEKSEKHVLAVREGAMENAVVVKALLEDLIERGLPTERPLLFVIDGSNCGRSPLNHMRRCGGSSSSSCGRRTERGGWRASSRCPGRRCSCGAASSGRLRQERQTSRCRVGHTFPATVTCRQYLAGERPAVAHRYAIALEDAFERIRAMPEVGVWRADGKVKGMGLG